MLRLIAVGKHNGNYYLKPRNKPNTEFSYFNDAWTTWDTGAQECEWGRQHIWIWSCANSDPTPTHFACVTLTYRISQRQENPVCPLRNAESWTGGRREDFLMALCLCLANLGVPFLWLESFHSQIWIYETSKVDENVWIFILTNPYKKYEGK